MPRSFLVKKVKYPVANHHTGGPRWYRQPSSPTEAAPVPSPQPSSPSRGGAVALPAYGFLTRRAPETCPVPVNTARLTHSLEEKGGSLASRSRARDALIKHYDIAGLRKPGQKAVPGVQLLRPVHPRLLPVGARARSANGAPRSAADLLDLRRGCGAPEPAIRGPQRNPLTTAGVTGAYKYFPRRFPESRQGDKEPRLYRSHASGRARLKAARRGPGGGCTWVPR
ncbi:hypothetical protein HPB48_015493 [Haemaphysalis longicornis]|uniref:Uncharacterized protein n=1 Tax=Haemaphysalis longicornis TaxID=44386 RepID=A0A9J6FJQ6_HAELO|nr:hypothetical protein HPB48_015493 [Haemaphysalis longicornis]